MAQVGIGAARAVISREVDLRFLTDGERVETAGMERRALPERQGKEQRVASPLSTHRARPVAERSGVDAFGSERKGGDPVAFIMYLTVWTGIGLGSAAAASQPEGWLRLARRRRRDRSADRSRPVKRAQQRAGSARARRISWAFIGRSRSVDRPRSW